MSACSAGKLCAAWVSGSDPPDYAIALCGDRYKDENLMAELRGAASKGLLQKRPIAAKRPAHCVTLGDEAFYQL
jgi:hypothetical protein